MESITPSSQDPRTQRVELIISRVLRIGVAISLLLILAGTLLTFIHHPTYIHSPSDLSRLTHPGNALPKSARDIFLGLQNFHGQAIVSLGLLVLVATPVLRVAISILAFLLQRDRPFVIITTLVLALLILSFFLGRAEG
jgi:uncharacterized membrane protein